jgi:Fe-S-cluster-containing dehydrogenase component
MSVRRRDLLTPAALALAVPSVGTAAHSVAPRRDAIGMLYDTTICTGCQACVVACSETNGLPPDTKVSNGLHQRPLDLNAQTKNIIKLYPGAEGSPFSFVKQQCMHCVDPSCVAGCPFHALQKDEFGVVRWEGSKCIGCRYCQIACPYNVPKFEWNKFNPKIVKCEFCYDQRVSKGKQPACTEVCPTGAVIFGTRDRLLATAKNRIQAKPGKYFEDRVYGEDDGGGTQVLYLSHVPFSNIGLPTLPKGSAAAYANAVHSIVYKWMALPIALYAITVAIVKKAFRHHMEEGEKLQHETGLPPQL